MEIPLLKSKKREAKQLIVDVLSRRHPLNARQVFKEVERDAGSGSYTYQAIHKALKLMLEDEVVHKSEEGFELNVQWLASLKSFSENVFSDYSRTGRPSIVELKEGESMIVKFDDAMVMKYYWMLEQCVRIFQATGKPVDIVVQMWRGWPLTVLGDKEFKQFHETFAKGSHVAVSEGAEVVDEALLGMWRKFNFKVKAGVPCFSNCETVAVSDWLLQVFHEEKCLQEWNELYSRAKGNTDSDLLIFQQVAFHLKDKATIIVTRDKQITSEIRAKYQKLVK